MVIGEFATTVVTYVLSVGILVIAAVIFGADTRSRRHARAVVRKTEGSKEQRGDEGSEQERYSAK